MQNCNQINLAGLFGTVDSANSHLKKNSRQLLIIQLPLQEKLIEQLFGLTRTTA